jgi:tetratricopeptide (TPR) repeat protein
MTIVLSVVLLSSLLQQPAGEAIATQPSTTTLFEKARLEYSNGRFARSEELYLSGLSTLTSGDESERAQMLTELGDVYVNTDELAKAERAYGEALTIYQKLSNKRRSALLLRNLGAVYSLERRSDEALSFLERALKEASRVPQPDPTLTGEILNSLGVEYFRRGNLQKAEQFLTQAVNTLPDVDGVYETAATLNNLSAIYHARRQYSKAEEYLSRAFKITEQQIGPAHPDMTFMLASMAILYSDTRQYDKAEQYYLRALKIVEGNPVFETRTARLLQGLSRNYSAAGRTSESEAALLKAAAIARRHLSQHSDMADILNAYASTLTKGGRKQEAEELRTEVRRAQITEDLVIKAHSSF